MQTKENNTDTHLRNLEPDEELAGILTAISIVSKRLSKKLLAHQKRDGSTQKGGNPDEQDE